MDADAAWARASVRSMLIRCFRALTIEQMLLAREHERVARELARWLP